MAKIHEEIVVIHVSKLIKENDLVGSVATPETLTALEQVAQELFGDSVIVEVEKA